MRFRRLSFTVLLASCGGAPVHQLPVHNLIDAGFETMPFETRHPADAGTSISLPPARPFDPLFTRAPLSPAQRTRMTGVSWRPECPVSLDALAFLKISHWDFSGNPRVGEMVVAAGLADEVLEIFRELYAEHFLIAQMRLVDDYGGDDDASMAANNSSAFNCRTKTGQNGFSRHSYGTAIDLNPVQNPYVKGNTVLPPQGETHLSRNAATPGLIVESSAVVEAFTSRGWTWGGSWGALQDYQHFEKR